MSAYCSLDVTLKDILYMINPSREDWDIRFRVIDELRSVVESVETLRGATVEPFGSFVSNLFTKGGDLDISIEIPTNGSYISADGKKYKQNLLVDVLKALRRKGGCHRLQFISHARVPILKFESNYMSISCDISINNLNGQMKSKSLFWINDIDWRFREMVLLVKEWAKAHGINDPKYGTLNSYSLSLLVIFHFQTCQPAILPPLKEIYPGNMAEDLTGVRAVAEKHIQETCIMNINRFMADRSRVINRRSLPELFVSFLAKFCDINLRASKQGISPYNGQWEDIESSMIWLPKTYALFVEDPFEQPVNCARGVSTRQLTRIANAFQRTHQMLTSVNVNQSTLLTFLVRPELAHFMARTAVGDLPNNGSNYLGGHLQVQRNPSSNGVDHLRAHPQWHGNPSSNSMDHLRAHPQLPGNPITNGGAEYRTRPQLQRKPKNNSKDQQRNGPQVHRAGRAPAPTQVQPQLQMVNSHPNNVGAQGSAQASHSQTQQRWRPRSEK